MWSPFLVRIPKLAPGRFKPKDLAKAAEFVWAGEAEGLTFEGKEFLAEAS
jgi:hypothetical protein